MASTSAIPNAVVEEIGSEHEEVHQESIFDKNISSSDKGAKEESILGLNSGQLPQASMPIEELVKKLAKNAKSISYYTSTYF